MNDDDVKEISHKALDAFSYIVQLYSSGVPSWSWYYPYHFIPPLCVVMSHIETYQSKPFEKDEPMTLLYHHAMSFKDLMPLPEELCNFIDHNPYFTEIRNSINADINEYKNDDIKAKKFRFKIPDLSRVKEEFEKEEVIDKIPN